MEPTAVTWAVLGLLGLRPMSGYDIKRAVDRTIRHFWAASYGQIYPELKRLEEAGWIAGQDAGRGGRSRRVYRITARGRRALKDWLHGRETRIDLHQHVARPEGRNLYVANLGARLGLRLYDGQHGFRHSLPCGRKNDCANQKV